MAKLNKKTKRVLIASAAAAGAGAILIKKRRGRQAKLQEPPVPQPEQPVGVT